MQEQETGNDQVADVHNDGDTVRRGVTIRRPLSEVRAKWAKAGISGEVEFREAPGELGTEVRVIAPKAQQSALKEIIGSWTSDDPGESLSTQLRKFKAIARNGRGRNDEWSTIRPRSQVKGVTRDARSLLGRKERCSRSDRSRSHDSQSSRCDHSHHGDGDLRIRSAPVQWPHSHHAGGRYPRPRVHGRSRRHGKGVGNLKKGDRVVVPFDIACGDCSPCKKGFYSACDNSNPNAPMMDGDDGSLGRGRLRLHDDISDTTPAARRNTFAFRMPTSAP